MKKLTNLILIKLFAFTLLLNAKTLDQITIKLDPKITENKYELADRYEEPETLPSEDQKKENTSINVDVDVNKEQKQIDSLKLDIGKKF